MAAEVPVCDILCEAMEYLSKLGSNLRSRSENLKEKRISKSKLRNAHAVHKAANKVLLICELSKKSLENVETGVRKVLSLVNAGQAHTSVGGKQHSRQSQNDNKNFYYFNYESYKLRISKKISIEHFTGVKVVARGMPLSMQEKYPVFYDCKLKRLRKKIIEKQTEDELKISAIRKGSCSSDKNLNLEKCKEKQNEFSKLLESDESESEKPSEQLSRKNRTDCNKTKSVHRKSLNTNPDDVIDGNSVSTDSLKTADNKSHSEQDDNDQNNANLQSKSGQDTVNMKEDVAVSELIECFANEAKVEEDQTYNGKTKSIRKKFSKIRIADDSSDSDGPPKTKSLKLNENQSASSKENEVVINESEPKSRKRKLSDAGDNSQSKDGSEASNSGNDSKPLIRCVNITKLLKPDILDSKVSESSKGKQLTKNNYLMKKGRVRKSSTNCNNFQKEDSTIRKSNRDKGNKSDDEFWALKRNEVKQFKPKEFSVNISKLPKLNINFLLTQNLQKITHASKTICEVTKAKDKGNDNLENNIDEVKNALLNESGSDDVDDALTAEANKVKNTLLNDSDSEMREQTPEMTKKSNKINEDDLPDTAAIKDALLNESDSENNANDKAEYNETNSAANDGKKKLEKEVAEKIKSALLNDSDSDKNQNDKNMSENESDRPEQCESTQDPEKIKSSLLNDSSDSGSKSPVIVNKKKLSKQKIEHAIKSMQAKKSLLHYSSSSENEEENSQKSNKSFKKHAHKNNRRKSRISSSSLDEENRKHSSRESDSQDKNCKAHSGNEDNNSRSVDQIDGTIDEHSNSSVSKVRT